MVAATQNVGNNVRATGVRSKAVVSTERKFRILIAHPGRQHSHQAAVALREAGYLACYATGVPVCERQFAIILRDILRKFSVYANVELPLDLTRVNMVATIVNRLLVRYLPERLIGPIQYETYRIFDRWVARLIAHEEFDAVIAYENSALYSFRAAKKIGAKCILDAASLHHVEQDRHYVSGLPNAYKARVDLRKDEEVSLADCIFTASDLAAKSYIANAHPTKRIKTILLGVDIQQFKPVPRCFDRPSCDPFNFIFIGSAVAKKGFDVVLDCTETLLTEGLSVKLLVVGRLDHNLLLGRRALRNNIRQYGVISQNELAAVLREAHCLLLPSRFDSFGMVVVEAMASGLPVIVSDMVGSRELVEEGRNGFVVPVGNPKALADRMRWCVQNPEILEKLSAAARATAEQVSWANYRRRFSAAVREVLL